MGGGVFEGVLYWSGEWEEEGWVVIWLLEGGIEILEGKGGVSSLGGWLPKVCAFTNTLEVEGIVWTETSDVVSEVSVWGRYV